MQKNVREKDLKLFVDMSKEAEPAQPEDLSLPVLVPAIMISELKRAFFKDQRAYQIGDILTVKVNITDKANFDNKTKRSRKNAEDSGFTDFIGSKTIVNPAKGILPGRILTADSSGSSEDKGSVDCKEALSTNIARVVTQVLSF